MAEQAKPAATPLGSACKAGQGGRCAVPSALPGASKVWLTGVVGLQGGDEHLVLVDANGLCGHTAAHRLSASCTQHQQRQRFHPTQRPT